MEMLCQDRTPEYLLQNLYEMELRRIALSTRISLTHSIGKQAAECAEKTGQVEAEFIGRLQQGQTRPGSVNMQLYRSTPDETIVNEETT